MYLESDSVEMVCVEICLDKAKNTIFGVIYKLPIMDSDKFLSSLEQDVLIKLSDEASKDIIIMGDFNANVVAPKLCKYAKKLIHATQLYGLNQLINEPTRVNTQVQLLI